MSVHSYKVLSRFDPDSFARAAELCELFASRQDKALIGNWEGTGAPVFSDTLISFNGVGDDGNQTFQIRLDGGGPSTCDTNHAKYDIVVRGCLLLLQEHLGDALEISIDQTHSIATELAKALVESYTGITV